MIFTVTPPVVLNASRKIIEGFATESDVYSVLLRRYFDAALSQVKPKACSNSRQKLQREPNVGISKIDEYVNRGWTYLFLYILWIVLR